MIDFKKYEKDEIEKAARFVSDYGAYTYAVNNTQEYLTNVRSFGVLQDKFPNKIAGNISEWVQENQQDQNILGNFLVGHSRGEVEAINKINGSLKGLLYEADFYRDDAGEIISNSHYDLVIKNRFTGKIEKYISVKSPWTETGHPQNAKNIEGWIDKVPEEHRDKILLMGPKELNDYVIQNDIPIETINVGTVESNGQLIDKMKALAENNDPSLLGEISFDGAGLEMLEAGGIGGIVSVGVSAIVLGLQYKRGEISSEYFQAEIMTHGGISFTSAGAVGGLSLLFPPGLLGLGIGIAVAYPLRRVIASAFGKGSYQRIFMGANAYSEATKATVNGIKIVYNSNQHVRKNQKNTIESLERFADRARITNKKMNNWYE